jgi:hypothetical protein
MRTLLAFALAVTLAGVAHAQTQPSGTWAGNVMPISPSVQTGTDANGNPVYAPKPGYRLIATPDVLSNTPAAAQYQVAAPLDGVWAGDDPANPTQTVELCFPDQATAEVTLSAYWTPPQMDPVR